MSIFSKILSGGADKLVEAAGTALDKVFTNKEELQAGKIEMQKVINEHLEKIGAEATKQIESENLAITDRWKADSTSDSWMSKNSRPLTLLSLLGFLYLIILSDSIEAWEKFNVKDSYVDLLQILLTTVVVAYFGGRSYEKGQSIKKK